MNFKVKFEESRSSFGVGFGEVQTASDGGYERGYAAGYEEGLATRKHETWTFTLTDGTIAEKDVALL